jgi:tetratricopeptide (TPR) repeat protein
VNIREKVLGKEHPDTATTYSNIAGGYKNQGTYPKAIEYLQKALDIREQKLGPDHPYTKGTKDDLEYCQFMKAKQDGASEEDL